MFTKRQLKIELAKQLGRSLIFIVIASISIYVLGGQIAETSQRAKENRTAVTVLEQKNQVTAALKNNLAAIGNGDKTVEEAFIKADDIIQFINKLEKIAGSNNLQQTLRFGSPVLIGEKVEKSKKDDIAKTLQLMIVEYNINLRGSANSLNNYLKEFEELPYFTSISSIAATSSPNAGWEKDSLITVKAQLYIRQ